MLYSYSYRTSWNSIRGEIPVILRRKSARRSVNFAREREFPDAGCSRVNISVTRILAAAVFSVVFSPPALSIHYSSWTGVCVYYWREPHSHRPLFSFFSGVSRADSNALARVPSRAFSRLRGRFNLPRRECVDTGKYSPATRSRMLGWRMAESSWKGSSKGNWRARVRREIGRGWWDYVFFPSRPSVRGFPLRRVRPFSCVLDPALLLKIGNRVLRVRTRIKRWRSAFDETGIVEWKR